ncbi:MAG: hypothetical protein ACW98X_27610 [Promethearchaeota archaeon]|jgi:hypothetical protein
MKRFSFRKYENPKGFEFVFLFIQFGWFYELDWYLYIGKLFIGYGYLDGLHNEWNPK